MGPDEPGAGSIESLYPFLYAGTTDLPAVLEEVRRSTVAKAEEIIEFLELEYASASRSDCRVALGGAFVVDPEGEDQG